jgi:hypothetical protein
MHFDLSALKAEAEPLSIAEALGLQTQKRGNRISILCPSHSDTHFGNCHLTETGYKCYACGAHGDVFAMVQTVKNVGFNEAVEFVANMYGGVGRYELDGGNSREWKPRAITADECRKIGLVNNPIFLKIGETYYNAPEYNNGLFKTELIVKSLEDDCPRYAIYELAERNPIQTLYDTDSAAYTALVKENCKKTIAKYSLLMQKIKDRSLCGSKADKKAVDTLVNVYGTDNAIVDLQRLIDETVRIASKVGGLTEQEKEIQVSGLQTLISIANSAFIDKEKAPF